MRGEAVVALWFASAFLFALSVGIIARRLGLVALGLARIVAHLDDEGPPRKHEAEQ